MFPGSGRVLGIQVENNYITLPGEIFEDESGKLLYYHDSPLPKIHYFFFAAFVVSFYYENISHLLPVRIQE